jgi:hypothetical protein
VIKEEELIHSDLLPKNNTIPRRKKICNILFKSKNSVDINEKTRANKFFTEDYAKPYIKIN